MMTTKIESRWQSLQPAPDKSVFQLLDASHPLKFYIGREMAGAYLFLLVGRDKPAPVKSMRAVEVKAFERPDGEWALLLSLCRPELAGLFGLLCEDLAASSRHLPLGGQGTLFVSRRLASWRALLEAGGAAVLSPSEVRGLFGELYFLDRYLLPRLGGTAAVGAWVGPFGADQDFQTVDEAHEVKTIHPDSLTVTISSEAQLYSSTRALNLVVLVLDEAHDGDGESLNALVSRVRSRLSLDPDASNAFEEQLSAAGYIVRDDYDAPLFRTVGSSNYRVVEGFPRIIASRLPEGVCAVNYQVSLRACTDYRNDISLDNAEI